ncbi:hypothetical protein EYZ66_11470 [Aequoribacter fuscus]|nr:hypothetical protein [Aequoribacter fuscus]QHJ88872.1 hypothetical protein EYZ66_11470 [Aequoribacter fuscus]
MKISIKKLLANKANAQKSRGPRTLSGKLASAGNAKKYSFTQLNTDRLPDEFLDYSEELIGIGYARDQAIESIITLYQSRLILDHKMTSYNDRYNDERLPDFKPGFVMKALRDFGGPEVRPSRKETLPVFNLIYKMVKADNDMAGLLFEKNDRHSKLIRYEQKAFNQLAKAIRFKK